MFSNRYNGRNNIVGLAIKKKRMGLRISQRELADRLGHIGMDVDKNAVQRMEDGKRFITDIELTFLSKVFDVSIEELYSAAKD